MTIKSEKRRMFTRGRIVLVAIALLVLSPVGVLVASSTLREYIYKELTYRLLTDRVVGEEVDPERIAVDLNEFVAENIYPGGGPGLDTHPLNDLVRGIGWCDQDAWLLGTLLATKKIPGRIVFLNGDAEPVAHTMAEVYVDGDWRLLDPLYGLVFRTADGELATLQNVVDNLDLVRDHPRVRALPQKMRDQIEYFYEALLTSSSAKGPLRWAPLLDAKRSSRARAAIQDALNVTWRVFGAWGAHRFQDVYLALLRGPLAALDAAIKEGNRPIMRTALEDPALFLYYRARNYHLYQRGDKAELAYQEVIARYPASGYAEKSSYFLGLLEVTARRNPAAAIERLNAYLQKYPDSAWLALAHDALGQAYEGIGNTADARRHYVAASDDPFVSSAYRLSTGVGPRSGLY